MTLLDLGFQYIYGDAWFARRKRTVLHCIKLKERPGKRMRSRLSSLQSVSSQPPIYAFFPGVPSCIDIFIHNLLESAGVSAGIPGCLCEVKCWVKLETNKKSLNGVITFGVDCEQIRLLSQCFP